jgi:hemolysin III
MSTGDDLPREVPPSQIRYASGGAVEEIFNSITHAVGAGLAIAGLVALMIIVRNDPSPWKYAGFSIYGASMILLFLGSAVMHSFAAMPRVRRVLLILDQAFIFVLIAGTYTPICLIAIRDSWGWVIFGIVWAMAALGIVLKATVFQKETLKTDIVYLPMGWLIVLVFRPIVAATSTAFIAWALIGGACYTVGIVFYAWRKLPFSHVIWHLFVIGGCVSFYLAYALHLA